MMIAKKLVMLALAAVTSLATVSLAQPAYAGGKAQQAEAADTADEESGTVNLNSATEEELQRLPGVGPAKATRIVDYRKKHGDFKKVEDLTKVKGFGYKTFKKLKPHLAVSGATTYQGKPRTPRGGAQKNTPPAEMP